MMAGGPSAQGRARTRAALWTALGQVLDTFGPDECRRRLTHSGFDLLRKPYAAEDLSRILRNVARRRDG
jgi:hypothetical protein